MNYLISLLCEYKKVKNEDNTKFSIDSRNARIIGYNILNTETLKILCFSKIELIFYLKMKKLKVENIYLDGADIVGKEYPISRYTKYTKTGITFNAYSLVIIGKSGSLYRIANPYGKVRVLDESMLIDEINTVYALSIANANVDIDAHLNKKIEGVYADFDINKIDDKEISTLNTLNSIKHLEEKQEEWHKKAQLAISKLKLIGKYSSVLDEYGDIELKDGILPKSSGIVYIPQGVTYMSSDYTSKLEGNIIITGQGRLRSLNFEGNTKLKSVIVLSGIGGITDLDYSFEDCTNLETVIIVCRTMSNIHSLESAFKNCKRLKKVAIIGLNTYNCRTMAHMFQGCESLRDLDIDCFSTEHVGDYSLMFCGCKELKDIDLSHFTIMMTASKFKMFADSGIHKTNNIRLDNNVTLETRD